jgi:hypothetical protein
MQRFDRDPQSELVRRYQRILRSAPAEATRFATPPRTGGATAAPPVTPLRRTPAGGERASSSKP